MQLLKDIWQVIKDLLNIVKTLVSYVESLFGFIKNAIHSITKQKAPVAEQPKVEPEVNPQPTIVDPNQPQ